MTCTMVHALNIAADRSVVDIALRDEYAVSPGDAHDDTALVRTGFGLRSTNETLSERRSASAAEIGPLNPPSKFPGR